MQTCNQLTREARLALTDLSEDATVEAAPKSHNAAAWVSHKPETELTVPGFRRVIHAGAPLRTSQTIGLMLALAFNGSAQGSTDRQGYNFATQSATEQL